MDVVTNDYMSSAKAGGDNVSEEAVSRQIKALTKVNLTGAEEVPPVRTSASGSGSFTIGKDGAVKGSVTTTGVQGTMAHIHQGAKGQNGGVIVPLTKSGDTYTAPTIAIAKIVPAAACRA